VSRSRVDDPNRFCDDAAKASATELPPRNTAATEEETAVENFIFSSF